MDTQWRHGINGATGMDYTALHRMLDDRGLQGPEREALYQDIRHCERHALRAMRGEPDQGDIFDDDPGDEDYTPSDPDDNDD